MPHVIGVAGPAGSGKSTLLRHLLRDLQGACALYIDDYQRITREPVRRITQWMERGADFDEFAVPLVAEHLEQLKRGEEVIDPLTLRRIAPGSFVLFETHFGRAHRETGRQIDLLVWLDTPPELALARNLRDFLRPMLPGGPIEPDRQRIGAVDTYLASYVSDVWALIALQTRRVRPGAEIVVDGSRPPEQIAAEVHRQIVARFP